MARFAGNARGRTLAETIEKATGHLSDKAMPKAMVSNRGKRFSPRPAAKPDAEPAEPEPEAEMHRSEPAPDDAQD